MTNWKSTMGAPLLEEDAIKILEAWTNLYHHSLAVPPQPEPLEMLNYCSDMQTVVWEVRRAVSDAWYYANEKAFPDPVRRTMPKAQKAPSGVDKLLRALNEEQINELLKSIEP